MSHQMIPCTSCPDPSLIGRRIAFCSGCGQQRFYGKGPCLSCGARGPASCATCDDRGYLPMPHPQEHER